MLRKLKRIIKNIKDFIKESIEIFGRYPPYPPL